MISILTDKATDSLGLALYRSILDAGKKVKYFCLDSMHIEPCYACRGCEEKTYGRCVVRDDADLILPCLIHSQTIIVMTSVVFGGYSFKVKRLIDKLSLIIDRRYHYRQGELVKSKTSNTAFYVIGLGDGVDQVEANHFKQLINENIWIAAWSGEPLVLPYDKDTYEAIILEVAG
ncbi:MAG: hypothetical protein LBU61_06035 [Coriobacteriales bacterium]|nr:hypothetical protein [Coriobacteriales bacterium]